MDEDPVQRLPGGVVPFHLDLLALGLAEPWQLRDRQLRRGRGRGEQPLAVPGQAGDRGGVEQVGGVLHRPAQLAGLLSEVEQQIELRRGPGHLHRPQPQIPDLQALSRKVLHENITWNSGAWARLRSGASSSTSCSNGNVLVQIGGERRLARPAEQLAEGGRARQAPRSTSVLTKNPISPSL